MSEARPPGTAAQRVGTGAARLVQASRALTRERRPAAFAAIGLFLTLFLPWYQEAVVEPGKVPATLSVTGWGAFSWVEAAVLLVAAGVLTLLFFRAEGRAFHLPGGDGWVIAVAGAWTSVLIVWRIFDKSASTSIQGPSASVTGIEWGIFVALGVAAFLAYSGNRIRAAHVPEPALPGEQPPRPTGEQPPRPTGEQPPPSPHESPPPPPHEDPLAPPPATAAAARRPESAPDAQLTIPLDEA
jgi:hypothetical protein